ncbi:unnamed protein product [Mucor hiemalis]
MMADYDKAMNCYESALRHCPYSIPALTSIASLFRGKEQFGRAIEYFKRILAIQESNGEAWASLGHCCLMVDNLQEAYHAYQQALYHLSNPKDPKLWYGIGILYDRYGSLEHAEEAFSAVMKMDPNFEKANEIYFRLGIIYKQQRKYDESLQCLQYVLQNPPKPLTESDIWFQTGYVYEQKKEYDAAKRAYEHVLADNPDHAKVLQQLGWLYHQPDTSFCDQQLATQYLRRSLDADNNDAQTWYLLGRCYMADQDYNRAYEAYQQAVYRDARNPTFWCSIGVLYYQINQYRDALDAYSRAIRLNPNISEVWYDLGTLYESCNNQVQDALDAYQRAAELDPSNPHIRQRLDLLRQPPTVGARNAPTPQDVVNPGQYSNDNDGNSNSGAGSSNILPFDNRQGRRGGAEPPRVMDRLDITTPGRDLPVLSNANIQRGQVMNHHIPEINGIESSPSSISTSNPRMNPMLLNNNSGKDNADNVKKEEPRSPQPSSFKQNQKDTPTETTTAADVAEDEEMSETVQETDSTEQEPHSVVDTEATTATDPVDKEED